MRSGQRSAIYDYAAEQTVQDSKISAEQLALPFIHPAYEALLFAPITLVGFSAAYLLFLLFNLVLCYCAYCLLRRNFKLIDQQSASSLGMLLASSLPVTIALMQGQDSLILLALLCAAQLSLTENSNTAAGIFLGLGLFRFQITIPIAVLYMLRRNWGVVLGFITSAASMAGISIALAGTHAARTYLDVLLNVGSGSNRLMPQAAAMMPNLRGLIEALFGGKPLDNEMQILIFSLSIGLLGWCVLRTRSFANAVMFAVLVSYHALPHDLSLLIVPVSALTARVIGGKSHRPAMETLLLAIFASAPTVLLFWGARFYLLAIFLIFLLVFENRLFEGVQSLERTPISQNG